MDRSTDKIVKQGLTFNDVLLIPGKSDVLPKDVDLRTRLTRNIDLNIPLVSAAMDTVTEARLAIAMAQEGGIGIIHKNFTLEEQAEEVEKVKRSESGMIVDPVTLSPDHYYISEALTLMQKYRISGVPIVAPGNRLVGILTNRDLRFEKNLNRKVKEVMTSKSLITAKLGISLEAAQEILQRHRIEKLPRYRRRGRLKGPDYGQRYREKNSVSQCVQRRPRALARWRGGRRGRRCRSANRCFGGTGDRCRGDRHGARAFARRARSC